MSGRSVWRWYLSAAVICLVPAAAAAGDVAPASQNQDFSLEGDKGPGGAKPQGQGDQGDFSIEGQPQGQGDQGGFSIEGQPAAEAEKKEGPSWETQSEVNFSSEIEAGILYNSANSFKHGEYTGLTNQAPYGIGNFDIRLRNPYDSKDTDYVETQGTNLGLDSREVKIKAGRQGLFEGYIDYDQIPKFLDDSARTPFLNPGSTFQALPPNWVGGANTGDLTTLNADLRPVDLSYDRKQIGGGFTYIPAPHWEFRTDFQREWKNGTKSVGAVIGTAEEDARSVLLAEPINYLTDQGTMTLAYADERMQGELSYYVSLFNDQNSSLTWQNPFLADPAWAPAAGFPTGFGQLSLPPDNQFHQINFSGGYNIDPETSTRANLDLSYGWMLQNDSFLPYTVNPALIVTEPLPRNSLNGEINTTLVNFRLTSHPWQDVRLRGGYRYDDRANHTPVNQYNLILADAMDQDTAAVTEMRQFNRPYSYTQHKIDVAGDYDFLPHTTGTLGYDFEKIRRTLQEVDDTNENTGSARLKTSPFDFLTVTVNGAYGARRGSTYNFASPLFTGFTQAFIDSLPPDERFRNDPALRKFYEANRNRSRFGTNLALAPLNSVSIGLRGDFVRDDYPDSELGLQTRNTDAYTVNLSYAPADDVTTYAFYTLMLIRTNQAGRSVDESDPAGTAFDPSLNWFVSEKDTIHTAGVGADWKMIRDRLDLHFDYTFSDAFTDYDFVSGLPNTGLSTIKAQLNSAGVLGTYHLTKEVALKMGYRFETYRTSDWALDNVNPTTLTNVLTFGNVSPDYTVHLIMTSVAFKF